MVDSLLTPFIVSIPCVLTDKSFPLSTEEGTLLFFIKINIWFLPLRHHRLAPFSKALYLTPLLLAAFHHGRMGRHALCSLNAEGLNKYNLQKIEYANGRPKQKIDEHSCSTIIERVWKHPKNLRFFAQNSTALIYPLLVQWPLHPWVSTYVFFG